MRWVEHVASMEQGIGGGDLMERDHLEDLSVDGRIILKLVSMGWEHGLG
jgi:hypothetical protein